MIRTKFIYLAIFAALLSPQVVTAGLIEGLCDGTADATVTCDTDTSREWLDLPITNGLSVDDFLADVGGFVSSGWSWATSSMVDELFLNAGAVNITGAPTPGNEPATLLLIALLGTMGGCSNPGSGACGFSDSGIVGTAYAPAYDSIGFTIWGGIGVGTVPTSYSQNGVGIFAVRDGSVAVAEPSILGLLSLGLAGIALSRRRRISA